MANAGRAAQVDIVDIYDGWMAGNPRFRIDFSLDLNPVGPKKWI